jgi:2,3-bisphosphoglycerate-independent phosphoglycerate mutase
MNVPQVSGATGYIDTNFEGKALATLKELANGQDLVFLHIEAPDECGHRGEIDNKVKSIELIDSRVLALLLEGLAVYDDYKILIMPDHPTPLATKTHSSDPVPYLMYQKSVERTGAAIFSETTAAATGKMIDPGYFIMKRFIEI